MKKSKIVMAITIGIMSFIMIYVMLIQFNIVENYDGEEIELMRETELKETLASYKEKYQEVTNELDDTNAKIAEYQKDEKSEEDALTLLEEEVEQKNMLLGLTDVGGTGIIITMENPLDSSDAESRLISAEDIILLINELRGAGAEAISINGQRIVSTSDVFELDNYIYMINGEKTTAPFTIKAIGDITYLQSALNIKGGYIDTRTSYGYRINMKAQDKVTIEKYSGNMTLNYVED